MKGKQTSVRLEQLGPAFVFEGAHLYWQLSDTMFGLFGCVTTDDAVLLCVFVDTPEAFIELLTARFPGATFKERTTKLHTIVHTFIFEGKTPLAPIVARVSGTTRQFAVWCALLTIPRGTTTTYKEIAKQIGTPAAVRSVGSVVGQNELALLVPCHRVIRADGGFGGYRWGIARKFALIATEQTNH